MREVFSMWGKTKMVVLVALCAGVYAALLIPFKGFVLIPGVTEFRPASALPVAMGLLFGPAGAWGAAIGNLIGDFFGTLGAGSIFGFFGNFFFAYVPYKIWVNLAFLHGGNTAPQMLENNTKGALFTFVLASVMGSMACALVIAWGCDVIGTAPFAALASIIMLNNFIPSVLLGLPILMVLYPRVKKWDLLWGDIVDESDVPLGGVKSKVGALLMCAGILFGWLAGLMVALGIGQGLFSDGFSAEGAKGSVRLAVVSGIGLLVMVVSFFVQTTAAEKLPAKNHLKR